MAAAKKKAKVKASEVEVGSRTLDNVLMDLAEQIKANDARSAERAARMDERAAQLEAQMARNDERSARAEEAAAIALQTIAAVSQDLRAITQEFRAFAERAERRIGSLEDRAMGEAMGP
jgi:uncharacterized membrane protein YccC